MEKLIFQIASLDNTCIKVYNPFEKDPAKKLIATHPNYTKAANALGLRLGSIHRACAEKSRIFAPKLNQEVAIRLSAAPKPDPVIN